MLLVNQVPAADKPRSLGWDFKYDVATQRPLLFHTGYTGTFLIDVQQQSALIFYLIESIQRTTGTLISKKEISCWQPI